MNHLYNFSKRFPIRGIVRRGSLGLADCLDRQIQAPAFFFHHAALPAQHSGQIPGAALQQLLDFLQRKSDELQRQNLLQPHQIPVAIQPVSSRRPAIRREQAQTVIVMQSPHGDSRAPGKLLRLV